MLDKIPRRMTPEEFYAWQDGMDEKYELVDGRPVKRCPDIEMMTGASRRHDRIVWNLIRALGNQLGDGPCQGFTSDTAVLTMKDTRRRPDVGIECGGRDDRSLEAADVRFVAEVLSPSTRELDMFGKLEEYREISSMRYVLLVEPNAPRAILWSRRDDLGWRHEDFEGLEVVLTMPELDISLGLRDVYSGLTFRPAPTLVEGDES
jgi:Uma2 family endonuclease